MDVAMLYKACLTKSTLMRLAFFVCSCSLDSKLDVSLRNEVVLVELVINGEARTVTDVATVADLLVQFKLEQKILVIELNRDIIERTDYEQTRLNDGDRIEIVHFVGGG